jgi:energy-coupling factor transporter ATP-binding protein EcfA2
MPVPSGRALELLDYLGVADRADHLPRKLSGGQQQRVAVARALANNPPLILADEPTAALDAVRGRQVMELFRRIAREQGACVIVVTHDYRALDGFDRLLRLDQGQMSEEHFGQYTLAPSAAPRQWGWVGVGWCRPSQGEGKPVGQHCRSAEDQGVLRFHRPRLQEPRSACRDKQTERHQNVHCEDCSTLAVETERSTGTPIRERVDCPDYQDDRKGDLDPCGYPWHSGARSSMHDEGPSGLRVRPHNSDDGWHAARSARTTRWVSGRVE